MNYKIINLKTVSHPDTRYGCLTFAEIGSDIPFEINRIFWIYGTDKDISRGAHAHKKNWQLLYCPYGSIRIDMDDGKNKERIVLDNPSKGLVLPPHIWHEMVWNINDSVLCVAASDKYAPDDYLRDYNDFLKYYKAD